MSSPEAIRTEPELREIVVKFKEGGSLTQGPGGLIAEGFSLERFNKLLGSIPGATARQSYPMTSSLLRATSPPPPLSFPHRRSSLELFVDVLLPHGSDLKHLVREFDRVPEVEYAIPAPLPGKPPQQAPDLTGQQTYLQPAPTGVDASYAWRVAGGDGSGVFLGICDGGYEAHQDFPANIVTLKPGTNAPADTGHGQKVLGIIVAKPASGATPVLGVTGICHNVKEILFAPVVPDPKAAIDLAIYELANRAGARVLVLEMHAQSLEDPTLTLLPVELNPATRAALRDAATNLGITVVEAAGNQGMDLKDVYETIQGNKNYIWGVNLDDSLAIMVGAGSPTAWAQGNYGERVDCQGQGQKVATTGLDRNGLGNLYNTNASYSSYTDDFGGTSSATAIVAGVVACLQGAVFQANRPPLDAVYVRELLRTLGTAQTGPDAAAKPIGPLPNLCRLLREVGIHADVYMRDNVADQGIEPYMGGMLCWSPDIIVRRVQAQDPATEFGLATWQLADLGENVARGQDNYIYVRMHNRGNAPDDVAVSLYWTEPSAFVHPSSWNPLGTLAADDMKPGEYRVIPQPMVWQRYNLPPSGHYCLIAVVQSKCGDAVTIPGAFATTDEYLDFVRGHNNICYRNVQVVEVPAGEAMRPLYIRIPGQPRPARRDQPEAIDSFRLEVHHGLPDGSRVLVEIGGQVPASNEPDISSSDFRAALDLDARRAVERSDGRPVVLWDLPIARGAQRSLRLTAWIPDGARPGNYFIAADQYFERRHLGRVNFVVRVPRNARPHPK